MSCKHDINRFIEIEVMVFVLLLGRLCNLFLYNIGCNNVLKKEGLR